MEQTYVMVKPDGVQRGLVGEIISRIEKRGLKMRRSQNERYPAKPLQKNTTLNMQQDPSSPPLSNSSLRALQFQW